ncbi:MAG TPA: hypothetical protein VK747_02990 [Blastocatellia bacterium]|jgi:hypothetical protein|nr:hypothetical protein [Blastocatellia bacterium]
MKKALQVLLSMLALAACTHLPVVNPQVQTDWTVALARARQDVDSGNYFAADKILDEFVRTHQGTPEAREIGFWKAAYLIDPANERGSLDGGIAALDAYLSTDSAGVYREQAIVLRRTAAVAQGIASAPRSTADTLATPVKDTVVVVSKSRDEQIAMLKDQLAKSKEELAKANAELDRIKKRLANPSN